MTKRKHRKVERFKREYTPPTEDEVQQHAKFYDGDEDQAREFLTKDEDDFQQKAEREVAEEDQLIWAYYRASDWTQTEVVEHVVDEPDERPTQSQVSRIVDRQDDEILQSEIHTLPFDGQWFSDEVDVADVDEASKEYIRDELARLVVVSHTAFFLFHPERPEVRLDDLPGWAAESVSHDPMRIKTDKFWECGRWSKDDNRLSPAVRRQLSRQVADD